MNKTDAHHRLFRWKDLYGIASPCNLSHTGSFRNFPPTGRKLSWPGCEFIEVRAAKVQRVEGYLDRLSLLEQLGLVPRPPA